MRGVSMIEVILIVVAGCAMTVAVIVNVFRPQMHIEKNEINNLWEATDELQESTSMTKEITIHNEKKLHEQNQDILNLTQKCDEQNEELFKEIDKLQDHVARLRENLVLTQTGIENMKSGLNETIKVKIQQATKPLLVQLKQDMNQRTLTIEKWYKQKDGTYLKKSLSKPVRPKKKKSNIKKLNLEAKPTKLVQKD